MRKSILIIEDNNDIRENIAELLDLKGFNTITAASGIKGLSLAKESIPDLVICDIVISGMDGFELFVALKRNKLTRLVPFIFTTAQSQQADRQKAAFYGIENYLLKPFDEQQLFNLVEKYCSNCKDE